MDDLVGVGQSLVFTLASLGVKLPSSGTRTASKMLRIGRGVDDRRPKARVQRLVTWIFRLELEPPLRQLTPGLALHTSSHYYPLHVVISDWEIIFKFSSLY
ncbi:hypothetical protein BT93_J1401 [Corymbia citriodora subsp. variegata]|nr:hypothetical protein BT93_J1401 [Corymbia citriodora subsp. variegata]